MTNAIHRPLTPAELQQRRTAATSHGLFAKTGPNLRARSYRVGRLAERVFEACPDLTGLDAATVRKWAQLEVKAADMYARLEKDPGNEKLHELWLQTLRLHLTYSKELFLTPSSRLAAASTASSMHSSQLESASRAQKELEQLYGRPRAVEAEAG